MDAAAKCVYDSRMFKNGSSSGNSGSKPDTRTEEEYFKSMQSWNEKKVRPNSINYSVFFF